MTASILRITKKNMYSNQLKPLSNTVEPITPEKSIELAALQEKREQNQKILKQIYQPNKSIAKKRNSVKKADEIPLPILEPSQNKSAAIQTKKYCTSQYSNPISQIRASPIKRIEYKPTPNPQRPRIITFHANVPNSSDIRVHHVKATKESIYIRSVPIRTNKSILNNKKISTSTLHKSALTVTAKHVTTIDDFEIIHTIGAGCFGTVKLAKNSRGQPVAIKMVNKDFAIKMSQQRHIFNEKHLMASLNCIYALKCYETFQDSSTLYFVNEFIPGGTVAKAIKKMKYSIDSIVFYSAEILVALNFLHKNKIIYRDLKPDNILIDKNGHIKFIDLGLGKCMDSQYTYTLCGTPAYISPEQIKGGKYGLAADIWSFGVVVFELFAGRTPFYDSDPSIMYSNIKEGNISWCPNMPHVLKSLISSILVVEPQSRSTIDNIRTHEFYNKIKWDEIELHASKPPFVPQLNDPFDCQYVDKCKSNEELEQDRERRAKLYSVAHNISKVQLEDEFLQF